MLFSKIRANTFYHNNKGVLSNFLNLSFIQVSNAVLQIFLYPIILRMTGLAGFGYVMVANSLATLLSIFVNYGTNQSGIKDITLCRDNAPQKSLLFFSIIYTKLILFLISLVVFLVLYGYQTSHFIYYLFSIPIIMSEIFNPLFFFIGIEKLLIFNVTNIISKIVSILAVIFLITGPSNAHLVNSYLGISSLLANIFLFLFAISRYKMTFQVPHFAFIKNLLRQNFMLLFNSLSVHLQQSFFLFHLSSIASPLVLGAYSICDKIIWASRLLVSSFSSAIFPKITLLYKSDPNKWRLTKKNINIGMTVVFATGGSLMLLFPGLFISILVNHRDALSENYLRIIAFVPMIIALNSLNVIDILLRNAYLTIFRISLIIFIISIALSFLLVKIKSQESYAFYPLIIESCCLVTYHFFLRNKYKDPLAG